MAGACCRGLRKLLPDNDGMGHVVAKRWFIGGRVQGVGFRYFVQERAAALGLKGYARNLGDGRVEVYAIGPANRLSDLAGALHAGPRMADVRSVEEKEDAIEQISSFAIR
jgi:acylphosphatase